MTDIGHGLRTQSTGAPVAEIRPRRFSVHGEAITDPYAWLKAENWQTVLKDPAALPADIAAYLRAENAYAEAALAGTAALRRRLVAEMRGRIQEDESGVPDPDGPFAYYTRHREGGQHPLICRRPATAPDMPQAGPDPDETILIDGDREGAGQPFFEIAAAVHSDDHARLAWSADTKGSELYTIRVRDLATGSGPRRPGRGHLRRGDLGRRWGRASGTWRWTPTTGRRRFCATVSAPPQIGRTRHCIHGGRCRLLRAYRLRRSPARSSTVTASDHETSEVHLLDRHAAVGRLRVGAAARKRC